MSPEARALAVRSAGLLLPLLAASALLVLRRPRRREGAAVVLGTLWCFATLMPLCALARAQGWWSFHADGGTVAGIPVDLILGWALLWGAIPRLALPGVAAPVVAGIALFLDLWLMPLAAPVVELGPRWLQGELAAIVLVLLPALWLGSLTSAARAPFVRTALQGTIFALLVFGLFPVVAAESTGIALALPRLPRWALWGWLQLVALCALPGVAAAGELARRGEGTPFPWDPPVRLVSSGPFGYLRSPMQLSIVLTFLAAAPLLGRAGLAAAVSTLAFAALAGWHESVELAGRLAGYDVYRRSVPALRPTFRPWHPSIAGLRPPARLWISRSCSSCAPVAGWLASRRPVGLELRDAEEHPDRDLERITYDPGDGTPEETGICALARGLEHLSLPWAVAGGLARLPGVATALQLLADAVGPGPRRVCRTPLPE